MKYCMALKYLTSFWGGLILLGILKGTNSGTHPVCHEGLLGTKVGAKQKCKSKGPLSGSVACGSVR